MAGRRTTALVAAATAAAGAAVGLAGLAVFTPFGDRPARQVVVGGSGSSPGAAASPSAARADVAPASASDEAPTPSRPLVVDVAGCADVVAYEMAAEDVAGPQSPSALYVNADRDLAGGMASLRFVDEHADADALAAPGVTHRTTSFPDGTAVVEWTAADRPLAILSTKRLTPADVEALASGITAGSPSGFVEVTPPAVGATVYGSACDLGGHFVGVEVVSGDFAAQVAYTLETDPSAVEANGSSTVLTFNRHDPTAPVPVREVGAAEWQRLVTVSQAGTDRP